MLNDLMMHMEWADSLIWDAVLKRTEPDERLQKLLYHLHMTQRAFLQIWQQKGSIDVPPEKSFKDLPSIRDWARPFYAQAKETVTRVDPSHPTNMPWADSYARKFNRKADPTTFEQTAVQVAIHSTHHRGQMVARLRELGNEPPLVDFIVWIWIGKPGPVWP